MLFNSYEFIFLFLPITFFIYFYLNSKRLILGGKSFLVFSSLFFYSWWNPIYLPLILASMMFNYTIGNSFNKKINNKYILSIGILANIILLGYFKYVDFFIKNMNYTLNTQMDLLHLTLPLAISFFTFQQIAYLVDSYRGETKEYDFLNYALFVTFFPQLIAGPIVHHKEMMPQFSRVNNLVKNYKNIALGMFIFSIGLFKKIVIADTFAIWATNGFDNANILNFMEGWVTSLSYTFQIYFDFSGYTDMAIGTSLLFNIKLPINFNSPYKSLDIQDFWRRWHITLSRFLKDYIYIPLGGNRIGKYRNYLNLFSVFLIGGLWHGASWMFVIWGVIHGIAIVIHRIWSELGFKMNRFLAWFITFNFINVSWVFFRAKDLQEAIGILKAMFGFTILSFPISLEKQLFFLKEYGIVFSGFGQVFGNFHIIVIWVLFGFILTFLPNKDYFIRYNLSERKKSFIIALMFLYAIFELKKHSEFLYFNF